MVAPSNIYLAVLQQVDLKLTRFIPDFLHTFIIYLRLPECYFCITLGSLNGQAI